MQLSVSLDGPDRRNVLDAAIESTDHVREWIERKHGPQDGPITGWTSETVQIWSDRPWSQDGAQRDLVYHANVGLTVEFSDFGELATFIDEVGGENGVAIARIEWTLTESRRTEVLDGVRTSAVEDAVAKARLYARSLGLADVHATAVADEGMLEDSGPTAPVPLERGRMMSAVASGGPELSLRPEPIVVEAVVDARFTAA